MDLQDPSVRRRLRQMLLRMFELWGLPDATRAALLDLAEEDLRQLIDDDAPLGSDTETMERTGYLFAIYGALESLYPENVEIRDAWVSTPHALFGGSRPVDVMVEQGLEGLADVARVLRDEMFR